MRYYRIYGQKLRKRLDVDQSFAVFVLDQKIPCFCSTTHKTLIPRWVSIFRGPWMWLNIETFIHSHVFIWRRLLNQNPFTASTLFFVFVFSLSHFCSPFRIRTPPACVGVFLFSLFHQWYANEKINNLGRWDSRFLFLLGPSFRWLSAALVFVAQWIFFCCSFPQHPLPKHASTHLSDLLQSLFLLFSKPCANGGAGIIHVATGMHLGVTLPRAVHHPPSYLCVPRSFSWACSWRAR